MYFGKVKRPIPSDCFQLNQTNWKYLGFHLLSRGGKFLFDPKDERKNLYRANISIIISLYKPSELQLFLTNCVSIFTSAIEVKEFLARDMSDVNVAMNDGIRQSFGWNRWESVRHLRGSFGYHDIYTLASVRRRNFMSCIPHLRNHVLSFIVKFCDIYKIRDST